MTKIFVVTDGDYSDYHIEAIFSNKEQAEEYVRNIAGEIEEWEMDEFKSQLENKLKFYRIGILTDGSIIHANTETPAYSREGTYRFYRNNEDVVLYTYCWAKNKTHAVKIANERRTRIMALNMWPTLSKLENWSFSKKLHEDLKELMQ